MQVPNMSLEDQFKFCMAPMSMLDLRCELAMREFAHSYAAGTPVRFNDELLPKRPPTNPQELHDMESWHKVGCSSSSSSSLSSGSSSSSCSN